MDMIPITPAAVRGAGPVTPVATTPAAAVGQARSLPLPGVAPTTVDLSSSGRFLSLASLFQKKTLDLQTSVAASADTSKAFADAAVAAAAVAGAFDELQTRAVDSNGLPTDTLDGQSLPSQFFQQMGGAADDAEASLAAIGLSFTPPTNSAASALTVDDALLATAFVKDPAATSALLERAASALLGVVGTQIQAQTANLSFLDDDSPFGAALPAPGALPPDLAAAPNYPGTEQASYANNMFLQNLVTENARNDAAVPDDSASAIAPPYALADLLDADGVPLQANPIAVPQAEVTAPGARADEPETPMAAVLAVNTGQGEPRAASSVATTIPESDTTDNDAVSVAQQASVLAQQLQAEREAAGALDEKLAGASAAVRAALADEIAQRGGSRAVQPAANKAIAQPRTEQLPPDATPDQFARPANPVSTVTTAQSALTAEDTAPVVAPQQAPPPAPNQAHLAARDPAIAAAIAAYHINTGAFAAQNARPDIPPPKPKPVAPVAAVTKVQATAALGTAGDESAPLR